MSELNLNELEALLPCCPVPWMQTIRALIARVRKLENDLAGAEGDFDDAEGEADALGEDNIRLGKLNTSLLSENARLREALTDIVGCVTCVEVDACGLNRVPCALTKARAALEVKP